MQVYQLDCMATSFLNITNWKVITIIIFVLNEIILLVRSRDIFKPMFVIKTCLQIKLTLVNLEYYGLSHSDIVYVNDRPLIRLEVFTINKFPRVGQSFNFLSTEQCLHLGHVYDSSLFLSVFRSLPMCHSCRPQMLFHFILPSGLGWHHPISVLIILFFLSSTHVPTTFLCFLLNLTTFLR